MTSIHLENCTENRERKIGGARREYELAAMGDQPLAARAHARPLFRARGLGAGKLLFLILGSLFYMFATLALAQHTEDEKLQAFYWSYLEQTFRQQPQSATALGDHRFDGLLDDISAEARGGWRQLNQQTLERLPQEIGYEKLSRDGQIDFEILRDDLIAKLWNDENFDAFSSDARTYGAYIGDSVYLLLTKSTAPKEINIANAIARMAEIPRIIAEAKRSLTKPVMPVLETAIRQNLGNINFYEEGIFQYAGETAQREKLKEAAARVAAELGKYQKCLESEMRGRAVDGWRIGKDKFARKFELETGAAVTAEQNLADAEAEFKRVHGELCTVARQLWSSCFPGEPLPPDDDAGRRETVAKVIKAVSQEHGTIASMLGDAKQTVASIRAFIRKKDYLWLPVPDRCAIIEMPEFRRGNSLAYLDNAPPLDPNAASYYAVSPPPEDWPWEQQQSFLEEYNKYMLEILTIHEAFPGHYVQFQYANRIPSLIRRVLGSGSYIEGWAVYGEVTMLNEGYGDGNLRLRLMQLKFYLRAVVNSILDYKMHSTLMSDEEAMKLLMDGSFQSEGEAKLKIIRAKQSAVQLSTYFVGRMAHYRLRQTIQREMGDQFNLGSYHEAVLSVGAVPPKYLPELVRSRLAQPR